MYTAASMAEAADWHVVAMGEAAEVHAATLAEVEQGVF